MGDLARVEIDYQGDTWLATIVGEIDASNGEDVGHTLDAALDNTARRHIVDLSQMRYVDSVGIRLLFVLAERLRARGRTLHVVVPAGAAIRRVLELADLGAVAAVHARLSDVPQASPQTG